MTNPLGNKIKSLRTKKGLTLEQLAVLTGSSKSYVWEIENRKDVPRLSAEKLTNLASTLGVTVDYFVDDSNDDPSQTVLDDAFFRDFKKMHPDTKEKIRRMIKVWEDQ